MGLRGCFHEPGYPADQNDRVKRSFPRSENKIRLTEFYKSRSNILIKRISPVCRAIPVLVKSTP